MDIPPGICSAAFDDQEIKKGTIIRLKFRFPNGTERFKFFVVLNKALQDNPLLCVITTTKLDFYFRNAQFNPDTLTIAAGVISCFSQDTLLDCRQIKSFEREVVKNQFLAGDMTFEGALSQDLIEKIDDVVRGSRLIAPVYKKKILGS